MQLNHENSNFVKKEFPITLLCDNVNKPYNIGSLFRVCDALGLKEIVFCNTKVSIPSKKIRKTSRSTEKYVPFRHVDNIVDYLLPLKESHQIIALEITQNSKSLQSFSFNFDKPIVLVIGDENFGVSNRVLEIANTIIHIDMFGNNSSMNVVQAANIAIYEMTKQFNQLT